MGSVNPEVDAAKKRSQVVHWLNALFPDFNLPLHASEEELRAQMSDGVVLCAILNRKNLSSIQSQRGVFISTEQRLYNLKRFLSAMDEMGLPRFNTSDLEQGSMSAVVDCLLSLRDRMSSGIGEDGLNDATKYGSQPRKKWNLSEGDRVVPMDVSQGNLRGSEPSSPLSGRSTSESKSQNVLRNPFVPEPSTAMLHPVGGHKFPQVFQLQQGRYSDLPAAKISEMMKSNSLDNAPTQSLLSVVNGILDESIERKNGEIPHRVACLLRKVVQEIERRISTQADHIRSQNNLIKAREEKYQSRIRVLETLASGTSEETQIVSNQLQKIKIEKTKIEYSKKTGDQDVDRLIREKDKNSDHIVSELKQELENMKKSYKNQSQHFERNSNDMDKLIREKENSDHLISELKQELENVKKSYNQSHQFEGNSNDMDKLIREKENSDHLISELKQELENVKKSYNQSHQFEGNSNDMDKLIREKENSDHMISELKQELENVKKSYNQSHQFEGNSNDKLTREKDDSDHMISELKKELENVKKSYENHCQQLERDSNDKLTREKEDSDHMISELKQELEKVKKSYENRCQQLERNSNDKLTREKEDSDRMISELKQELEKVKKSYENRCQQLERNSNDKLKREKEDSDHIISELKKELENVKKSYENRCQQLERNSNEIKTQLEKRIQEAESLLVESRRRMKELEAFSESKFQNWNKKERVLQNFIGFQLQLVKNMRVSSESIKQEVIRTQKGWREEMSSLGVKLKVLVDAAENYHTVLAENRKLYNEVVELKGNIRVYCRVRPFIPGQNAKSTTVDYIGDNGEVLIVNPSKQGKDGRRMFKFNKAFGPASTQEQVYLDIQPLVRSVLDGYNVCIFAYGQTGSGKTYTMSGPNSPTKENWGVNYRALDDLFNISCSRRNTFLYEIGVQMVEIYNEQVRDLLTTNGGQRKLGILNSSQPNGLAVPDASMLPVNSTSDVMELMQFGQSNRAMSSTALNERSSRSHSIVTIHVRSTDLKTRSCSHGSLHLVDLAGSERVDRSEVTGDRLKEAQHINKSLSALGDVIFALAQKSNHVPYRNSKLTQVLQSSLGGHAKTLMFVQVNPEVTSHSETVSTLKFAERVSGIELGAAQSNKEGKDVKDLIEQVASLKDTIARKDEEIEELQLLKDLRAGSPSESNSLRQSLSSPGLSLSSEQRGQRLTGGRVGRFTEKVASDPENSSEFSDKHSENGSQQSADDIKHQKENDYADSDDRLSDLSDGVHSMGAETDSSTAESNFSETSKKSATTIEKMPRISSRMPKPLPQRTRPTMSVRPKLTDPLKSSDMKKSTSSSMKKSTSSPMKKSTSSQPIASSPRTFKR